MATPDLKVLYLLGFGRSGTTVMANVLGEVDGFFHAGELQRIWSRLTPSGVGRCGCGEQVKDCAFWTTARSELEHHLPDDSRWGETVDLAQSIDPSEVLDWQLRVTGRGRMRLKLEDATRPASLTKAAASYRRVANALYHSIAAVTGAKVIIDSSKIPQLGILLEGMANITPYYIQVVRDPRGVLYSRQRRRAAPSGTATGRARLDRLSLTADGLRWTRDNVLAAVIRKRVGPRRAALVKYEEFVARPAATLRNAMRFVGVIGELPLVDEFTARIGQNHTVCGNRNRFRAGEVAFCEDLAWRESLGQVDRFIATLVTAPVSRSLGYPMNASMTNGRETHEPGRATAPDGEGHT